MVLSLRTIFFNTGISSSLEKFSKLSTALPVDIVMQLRDLVMNPPKIDQYETLKTAVIKLTALSDERRITLLLEKAPLGDTKPTRLLRDLRKLAGPDADEQLLRQLWMQRLPSSLQPIATMLAKTQSLTELAEAADAFAEQMGSTLNNVRTQPSNAPSTSTTSTSDPMMAAICEQLAALRMDFKRSRPQHRSRSRSRRRQSRSRTRSPSPLMCWYHETFGDQARKCTPPCSFKKEQGN